MLSQPDRAGLFSMSFVQDRRDDPIDSHRGIYNTLDVGYAWNGFGSATNYTRLLYRNATYHRIGRDLVLAQGTQFGWIHALGSVPGEAPNSQNGDFALPIPLAERFFSGGASTNRAFPDNQAGPRDFGDRLPSGRQRVAVSFHRTSLPLDWQ